MINRGRDGMVNECAVSEGCSKECQWFVRCRSNARRRRTRRTPRFNSTWRNSTQLNDNTIHFATEVRRALASRSRSRPLDTLPLALHAHTRSTRSRALGSMANTGPLAPGQSPRGVHPAADRHHVRPRAQSATFSRSYSRSRSRDSESRSLSPARCLLTLATQMRKSSTRTR